MSAPMEPNTSIHLPQMVADTFAISTSEARRALAQGGVRVNGEVVHDLDIKGPVNHLQLGKFRAWEAPKPEPTGDRYQVTLTIRGLFVAPSMLKAVEEAILRIDEGFEVKRYDVEGVE